MKTYYQTLSKDKKEEIKQIYQKEYAKSDLQIRLTRLKIYSLIGYLFSIIILLYAFKIESNKTGSIILATTLIILATVYLIGSILIKRNVLNKIALKNK